MGTQLHVDSQPTNTATASLDRRPLWVVLAGSILFWVGLPFPVVFDYFEAENEAARIAIMDGDRAQFALSFGLLGVGAAVAGVGLWMLGRSLVPSARTRGSRWAKAATAATWFGLASAAGGLSRTLHAVFATPEYMADAAVDMVVGGIGWLGTVLAMIILGVFLWSAGPPKWTAVVMVLGGIAGGVTFLPLFFYLPLIVFAVAILVVQRGRSGSHS